MIRALTMLLKLGRLVQTTVPVSDFIKMTLIKENTETAVVLYSVMKFPHVWSWEVRNCNRMKHSCHGLVQTFPNDVRRQVVKTSSSSPDPSSQLYRGLRRPQGRQMFEVSGLPSPLGGHTGREGRELVLKRILNSHLSAASFESINVNRKLTRIN